MGGFVRYLVATLMAVLGGYVGYHFVPIEPFGVAGNVLFMSALFGLLMGLFDVTGFFGNIVNTFLITFPVYFLTSGELTVLWAYGNIGYAIGNVLGQLARLSATGSVEARAL
jgi:hypothetical protein